jgi:hypothetical protein
MGYTVWSFHTLFSQEGSRNKVEHILEGLTKLALLRFFERRYRRLIYRP